MFSLVGLGGFFTTTVTKWKDGGALKIPIACRHQRMMIKNLQHDCIRDDEEDEGVFAAAQAAPES
jgi:hypothetical protein